MSKNRDKKKKDKNKHHTQNPGNQCQHVNNNTKSDETKPGIVNENKKSEGLFAKLGLVQNRSDKQDIKTEKPSPNTNQPSSDNQTVITSAVNKDNQKDFDVINEKLDKLNNEFDITKDFFNEKLDKSNSEILNNLPKKDDGELKKEITDELEKKFQLMTALLNNKVQVLEQKILSSNNFKEIKELKGELERSGSKIDRKINDIKNGIYDDYTKFSTQLGSVKIGIEEYKKDLSEKISSEFHEKLKPIQTSLEVVEGKFKLLDDLYESQKDLSRTLSDKCVSIRQDISPSTEEDEIIFELSKYGQKIFDQLTLAARHYARNRKVIEDINSERIKYEQEKKDYLERGKSEGKILTIKDLIGKFEDLDNLFESESPNDKILVSFFKNNGLMKDENLSKNSRIDIPEENRHEFERKARFVNTGHFIVKRSCFEIEEEIICKAELEKEEKKDLSHQEGTLNKGISEITEEKKDISEVSEGKETNDNKNAENSSEALKDGDVPTKEDFGNKSENNQMGNGQIGN